MAYSDENSTNVLGARDRDRRTAMSSAAAEHPERPYVRNPCGRNAGLGLLVAGLVVLVVRRLLGDYVVDAALVFLALAVAGAYVLDRQIRDEARGAAR